MAAGGTAQRAAKTTAAASAARGGFGRCVWQNHAPMHAAVRAAIRRPAANTVTFGYGSAVTVSEVLVWNKKAAARFALARCGTLFFWLAAFLLGRRRRANRRRRACPLNKGVVIRLCRIACDVSVAALRHNDHHGSSKRRRARFGHYPSETASRTIRVDCEFHGASLRRRQSVTQ